MYCVISLVFRYYGRKCLSHFMAAAEFEKTAMRTLNSQQWAKLKDAVETLRVKVQQTVHYPIIIVQMFPIKLMYLIYFCKHTTHATV